MSEIREKPEDVEMGDEIHAAKLENDLYELAQQAHRGKITPEEHDRRHYRLVRDEEIRRSPGRIDGVDRGGPPATDDNR